MSPCRLNYKTHYQSRLIDWHYRLALCYTKLKHKHLLNKYTIMFQSLYSPMHLSEETGKHAVTSANNGAAVPQDWQVSIDFRDPKNVSSITKQ